MNIPVLIIMQRNAFQPTQPAHSPLETHLISQLELLQANFAELLKSNNSYAVNEINLRRMLAELNRRKFISGEDRDQTIDDFNEIQAKLAECEVEDSIAQDTLVAIDAQLTQAKTAITTLKHTHAKAITTLERKHAIALETVVTSPESKLPMSSPSQFEQRCMLAITNLDARVVELSARVVELSESETNLREQVHTLHTNSSDDRILMRGLMSSFTAITVTFCQCLSVKTQGSELEPVIRELLNEFYSHAGSTLKAVSRIVK